MRRLFVILGVVAVIVIAYFIIDWFGILEEDIPPPPPTPKADLAFDYVITKGTWNKGGRNYKIEVYISNEGDKPSNSFFVSVSDLEKKLEVNNIEPGETIPVVFNIDLSGGEQTIDINLDPDNRITEIHEYNNSRQLSFPPLHEFIPDYAPLTAEQIREYTLKAYNMGYESSKALDAATTLEEEEKANEMGDVAEQWLYRAIYGVSESNFEYEKLLVLSKFYHEFVYGKLSGGRLVALEEAVSELSEEWSKDYDKEGIIKHLRRKMFNKLGAYPPK